MKNLRESLSLGDSFKDIFMYWLPELVSNATLFCLPPLIDAYIVSNLNSNNLYGAMGLTITLLHFLIKLSETIPVAAMAVIGRYNGAKEYDECGKYFGATFWTACLFGLVQFVIIFLGAGVIFYLLGVPQKMINAGIPFLKLKSLGALLIFVVAGLFGFMRAVKNTTFPMILNIAGIVLFIIIDYALVLGKFGFPKLGLTGSAIATIIQYGFMMVIGLIFIFKNSEYKKYFKGVVFYILDFRRILHVLNLSWPIMIDKGALALSYVWLAIVIAPLGKYAIVTFDVVKNLERFAFLPAIASAQVITFLVSNRLGAKDPQGATANMKKILIFIGLVELITLIIFSLNSGYLASFFDPKCKFAAMVALTFPLISTLVVFDFIQLILAGALRGAGDVKYVMWGRFLSCALFFVPFSYILSLLPIHHG
jgi:putative MATE family efflux protein